MAFLTGLLVGAYCVPSLESIPVSLNHVTAGHNQHLFGEQTLPALPCLWYSSIIRSMSTPTDMYNIDCDMTVVYLSFLRISVHIFSFLTVVISQADGTETVHEAKN